MTLVEYLRLYRPEGLFVKHHKFTINIFPLYILFGHNVHHKHKGSPWMGLSFKDQRVVSLGPILAIVTT